MKKTKVIAFQEFRMMAATKAFIIATLLGPLFIAGVTILPTVLANRMSKPTEEVILGVTNTYPEIAEEVAKLMADQGFSPKIDSPDRLKSELAEGELDGFISVPSNLLDPGEIAYYSSTGTDIQVFSLVENLFERLVKAERIREAGLDSSVIDRIMDVPEVILYTINEDGETGSDGEEGFMTVFMSALSFVMIIYMTVLLYGQSIGRSVVKEKTSKTVELLLSSVKPQEMMFGKILGIGMAGLIQYAVWILLVGGGLILAQSLFDLPLLERVPLGNLGWLVVFFITAYFLYGAGYAAIGAAADDEQNMAQLGLPLIIFLIIPLVMMSTLIMNPGSSFAIFMSLFPLTSSLVMMVRVMLGDPAVWEIVLCFVLQGLTFWLFAVFGGRIFRVGILMTGKKMTLKELPRLLKG